MKIVNSDTHQHTICRSTHDDLLLVIFFSFVSYQEITLGLISMNRDVRILVFIWFSNVLDTFFGSSSSSSSSIFIVNVSANYYKAFGHLFLWFFVVGFLLLFLIFFFKIHFCCCPCVFFLLFHSRGASGIFVFIFFIIF